MVFQLLAINSGFGVPDDVDGLLKIKINQSYTSGGNFIVFGTGYEEVKDPDGKNRIIVNNPYEPELFGYRNTAKQKSFIGTLMVAEPYKTAKYVIDGEDPYLIPNE